MRETVRLDEPDLVTSVDAHDAGEAGLGRDRVDGPFQVTHPASVGPPSHEHRP